jgi:hypothetical protein
MRESDYDMAVRQWAEVVEPEGAAEQTFGGNEGIYFDLEGEQAPVDEVLS